jgi:hypothetical protein
VARKTAIFVNGAIHSGKSTIAELLAAALENSVYLEGDDLFSRENLTFEQWIEQTVRIAAKEACALAERGKTAVIAYPLRLEDWQAILEICGKGGVTSICITLAPDIRVALSKRSDRVLEAWELRRIHEMYAEGYHARPFSDLLLDNGSESPEQTVRRIQEFLSW